MSALTADQICAQIDACCGAPTEQFFREAVLKLLCTIRSEGLTVDAELNNTDTEIVTRCDIIDENTSVPFLRMMKFHSDATITTMDIGFDGATYTIQGTEGDCPSAVVGSGGPNLGWGVMQALLCDYQVGDTVKFFRVVIRNSEGDVEVIDTELDGETPYIATGTVSDCTITAAVRTDGEVYAGIICYDVSNVIREAVRFAELSAGIFTGNYRFFDARTGESVDVGTVVECPREIEIVSPIPQLTKWGHGACRSSGRLFDTQSLQDKLDNGCTATNYRITYSVDSQPLVDHELIGISHAEALLFNPQGLEPIEPLSGANQLLIHKLNEFTAPYIKWYLVQTLSGWEVQMTYSIYQAITLIITRVIPACGTSEQVDAEYVMAKTYGNAPVWTDTDTSADFDTFWGNCL